VKCVEQMRGVHVVRVEQCEVCGADERCACG
jgi:hypothetical protein